MVRTWLQNHPRWKALLLWWIPGLAVSYTLFGFLAVPALIKHQVVPRLAARTAGTISVESVAFNPFTWRLQVERGRVALPTGETLASAEHLDLNIEPWRTVFMKGWHCSWLRVTAPNINVAVESGGQFSFFRMVRTDPAASATARGEGSEPLRRIPRLVIDELTVAKGGVRLVDTTTSPPVEAAWSDLSFSVAQVDTRPTHNNPSVLSASTASGEKLTWSGQVFADPLRTDGTLRIEGLSIGRFDPYLQRFSRAGLSGGTLSLSLRYELAPAATPPRVLVDISELKLQDAAVVAETKPLLGAGSMTLRGVRVDAIARSVEVRGVEASGGKLTIRRGRDGELEVFGLLEPDWQSRVWPSTAGTQSSPVTDRFASLSDEQIKAYPLLHLARSVRRVLERATGDWSVRVDGAQFTDSSVRFEDAVTGSTLSLDRATARTTGPIDSAKGYELALTASSTPSFGEHASMTVTRLRPMEPSIELTYEVKGLDLQAAAAYLPRSILPGLPDARLAQGTLSATGSLDAAVSGSLRATLAGRADLLSVRLEQVEKPESLFSVDEAGAEHQFELEIGDHIIGRVRSAVGSAKGVRAMLPPAWGGGLSLGSTKWNGFDAALAADGAIKVRATGEGSAVAVDAERLMGAIEARVERWAGTADVAGSSDDLTISVTPSAEKIRLSGPEIIGPVDAALDGFDSDQEALSIRFSGGALFVNAPKLRARGLHLSAPHLGTGDSSFARLDMTGLSLDSSARTLRVQECVVDEPKSSVAVALFPQPDGQPVPDGVAHLTPADLRALRAILEYLGGLSVEADRVRVTGASLVLRDPTLSPPLEVTLRDGRVDLQRFDSRSRRPWSVEAAGLLNQSGEVSFSAGLDLSSSSATAQGTLRVQGVPTPPYSPVSSRFTGYVNDQGRLNLSVPVEVRDQTLRGTLTATLDRFFLTDGVETTPQTINLPVKLGLALLRDSKEQIAVSVPFEGRLDDPSFSLGGVIWQAVLNVLTKAVTAPFQLLGSLFGGGGDVDLSRVDFAPGSAEIDPATLATLDTLARALAERPALNVAVSGFVDPAVDGPALQRLSLRAMMTGTGATLTDEQYAQRLLQPYRLALQGKPGPERPAVEEMEALLLPTLPSPGPELDELASRRADAVVRLLVQEKKLAPQRVSTRPRGAAPDGKPIHTGAMVKLELQG